MTRSVATLEKLAQAKLDRRLASVALAGVVMGPSPLLWLIREALDDYHAASWDRQMYEPETLLLRAGARSLWLTPWYGRVLIERQADSNATQAHEVPNAALVLYDVVQDEPLLAERLLATIESAARKGRRSKFR